MLCRSSLRSSNHVIFIKKERGEKMKWVDTLEIAIQLSEKYPEVDPKAIRFTDLRDWVMGLEEFEDDPAHCGEKILEAIQMAWIEETE